MRNHLFNSGLVALVAAVVWTIGMSYPAQAQQEGSVMLPPPAGTQPTPAEGPAMQPAAPPTAAADGCCSMSVPAPVCQPCIDYRTHRSARKMLRCTGEKPVIVMAKNPADCCCNQEYEVPLCIPCCCEGAPCVTTDCGALGRGKVEYCWANGFSATVVFRARGDIMVHYRG